MTVQRDPLQQYLIDISAIRTSGAAVPETSYYGPLANLLNSWGATLSPKVLCVINPANRGAGVPDGGFYLDQTAAEEASRSPGMGRLPERGAMEVKPISATVRQVADSEQLARYLRRYNQVLVTNFREFSVYERSPGGSAERGETYALADDEQRFWELASDHSRAANLHSDTFAEFLKRSLQRGAAIDRAADVAWFLASYARDARARIERHSDLDALSHLRAALEEGVGFEFKGREGEHFFRSALVQTLFYGIFSAWVLWHRERPERQDEFNWRTAVWTLRVPMIRGLFEQLATPTQLEPLGLVEPLDWTGRMLNRVRRGEFFSDFAEAHAVQYFYEPFLEQYDPVLRKQLGVWYTPPEIVEYIVARIDALLSSIARRIAAILLMGPSLDVSYAACNKSAYIWTSNV